jgi:6-pyruvoyltetrahydropterin/6-carboxytetrahydropterin synthase
LVEKEIISSYKESRVEKQSKVSYTKKKMKNVFRSKKRVDGFSTCFRQWKATDTHCSYIHGYSIYFDITFEGDLDHRNWVADFGLFKRAKTTIDGKSPEKWFKYMFDHTLVIAQDDPFIESFKLMDQAGAAQIRILPAVGCEKFAEFVFHKVNKFIKEETEGRVRVTEVQCFEHEKNSAIYTEQEVQDYKSNSNYEF